jgi:hypothetical protein
MQEDGDFDSARTFVLVETDPVIGSVLANDVPGG